MTNLGTWLTDFEVFIIKLRTYTAKPPRNSTQREKNIYESATRLLANLESDCTCKWQGQKFITCKIHEGISVEEL